MDALEEAIKAEEAARVKFEIARTSAGAAARYMSELRNELEKAEATVDSELNNKREALGGQRRSALWI